MSCESRGVSQVKQMSHRARGIQDLTHGRISETTLHSTIPPACSSRSRCSRYSHSHLAHSSPRCIMLYTRPPHERNVDLLCLGLLGLLSRGLGGLGLSGRSGGDSRLLGLGLGRVLGLGVGSGGVGRRRLGGVAFVSGCRRDEMKRSILTRRPSPPLAPPSQRPGRSPAVRSQSNTRATTLTLTGSAAAGAGTSASAAGAGAEVAFALFSWASSNAVLKRFASTVSS